MLALEKGSRGRSLRVCVLLICTVILAALPAAAGKGSSLNSKGADAEARQDYEAAYNYYNEAYQRDPKNLEYRAATLRTRVLAGSERVHRGQLLREEGKLEEALTEFRKAAVIDPVSFIAQQEIRRTLVMIDAAKAKPSMPAHGPEPTELQKRLETVIPPVELTPLSGALISIKLTGDSKTIYQTVGRLAGINVVFDPDYASHPISVDLVGVTLPQALEILGYQSKTFWRALTPNTILISPDSPTKRKESEQNILMTYYLTNLAQASDLTEVTGLLRTTLDLTKVTAVPSLDAIIVRGTPDQVAIAGKLIDDMDKAHPEVVVDVAVIQITRDRLKTLGTTLPTSVTATMSAGGGAAGSATLTALQTINSNNFTVTLPSATVTALFSDSKSKLIQNPQIRATDGQKATMKIGERVPIATGVSSSTLTSSALTQTQFQYIDVGVNIDITPHVHANNDITLKLSLDISAVDSEQTVGGVTQPVIGQRKIEHEIRLKEGETNVLAGMLEDSNSDSSSGWPLLGQIPILRYLFASRNTDKMQSEVVFAITPHLVRAAEYTGASSKPLDIGTGSTVSLRHATPVAPPKASPTAAPPSGIPQNRTAPPTPPAVHRPVSPAISPRTQPSAELERSPLFDLSLPQVDALAVSPSSFHSPRWPPQTSELVQPQPGQDESKLQGLRVIFGGYLQPGEQTMARLHQDGFHLEFAQSTAADEPVLDYLSRLFPFDSAAGKLAADLPIQAQGRYASSVPHLGTLSLAETWGI
jgi:general secretion pathway protein D